MSRIIVKFPGINGEVVLKGKEKWCDALGASLQMSRPHDMSNKSGSSGAGVTTFHPMIVHKDLDAASLKLLESMCKKDKRVFKEDVLIEFLDSAEQPYLTYKLTNAYLAGYSVSGSSGDASVRPTETIEIVYEKIFAEYKGAKPDGSPGEQVQVDHNVKESA
jgi:type VI protein secretion system component Hcp